MTVLALDDTDSREGGMCTTFVATRIAERIQAQAVVQRCLLVRLHPGVPHKTRGNAAVAIHTDIDADEALTIASETIDSLAELNDQATHPGLVVAPIDPMNVPEAVSGFAREAMRRYQSLDEALELINSAGYLSEGWKTGRGRIGALAAVGAWCALDDWTYEVIAYRDQDKWGTPRVVEASSVFTAAADTYPATWDTVDEVEVEPVCVPHTPGPVLYGIRGDSPEAVQTTAAGIESECVADTQLFVTNQGTDAHLQSGSIGTLIDTCSYRVTGRVLESPETRRGGHVFFSLQNDRGTLDCVAFEPTKRFRDRVRSLRTGDLITVTGEFSDGTLKLEKFAIRSLTHTEDVTPSCPECHRTMKSAGANQGYRCRDCGTHTKHRSVRTLNRDIELGWYEVPPCARRHIAKPLIRGGYDAPIHPER